MKLIPDDEHEDIIICLAMLEVFIEWMKRNNLIETEIGYTPEEIEKVLNMVHVI